MSGMKGKHNISTLRTTLIQKQLYAEFSVSIVFVKCKVNVKHFVPEQWPQQRLGLEMCHFVSHSHILHVVSVDTGLRSLIGQILSLNISKDAFSKTCKNKSSLNINK